MNVANLTAQWKSRHRSTEAGSALLCSAFAVAPPDAAAVVCTAESLLSIDSSSRSRNLLYVAIYVLTGSSLSLLIKKSQRDGLKYEIVAINLAVEFTKLILCLAIFLFFTSVHFCFLSLSYKRFCWHARSLYACECFLHCARFRCLSLFRSSVSYSLPFSSHSDRHIEPSAKLRALSTKWNQAKYFAIPAGIYCVYNFLNFFCLKLVEPATFRILINSKVMISGMMLQVFFNQRLSSRQWVGIFLLFVGCGIEQIGSFNFDTGPLAICLILIQAFCSSLAGVYFQWLLQRQQKSAELLPSITGKPAAVQPSLWEKNLYLYTWSCLFNSAYLMIVAPHIMSTTYWSTLLFGEIGQEITRPAPGVVSQHLTESHSSRTILLIIALNSIGGFSTSLILRYMDVIIKEYSNFIEMVIVVIGANLMFHTPMSSSLLVSVLLVSISMYLYNVPHDAAMSAAATAHKSDDKRSVEMPSRPQPILLRDEDGNEEVVDLHETETHRLLPSAVSRA